MIDITYKELQPNGLFDDTEPAWLAEHRLATGELYAGMGKTQEHAEMQLLLGMFRDRTIELPDDATIRLLKLLERLENNK